MKKKQQDNGDNDGGGGVGGSHQKLFRTDPCVSLDQLTDSFGNLSVRRPPAEGDTDDANKHDPNGLSRQAIIFDYTVHPVGIIEKKRVFSDNLQTISTPFQRPIFIDCIGVIQSYHNCCASEYFAPKDTMPFPLVPLVRCLFYWISKGHRAVICWDEGFNPFTHSQVFRCTPKDLELLNVLDEFHLLEQVTGNNPLEWYKEKLENTRACVVSRVRRWVDGFPPTIATTDLSTREERERENSCHDRVLCPYFLVEGTSVIFVGATAKGMLLQNLIVDHDVHSREDFERFQTRQLSFMDQCKSLKVCFDIIPWETRQREALVMVEVMKRLGNILD